MFTIAESTDALAQLTNLGAAGVMGAMWLWERRNSQKRHRGFRRHDPLMYCLRRTNPENVWAAAVM